MLHRNSLFPILSDRGRPPHPPPHRGPGFLFYFILFYFFIIRWGFAVANHYTLGEVITHFVLYYTYYTYSLKTIHFEDFCITLTTQITHFC